MILISGDRPIHDEEEDCFGRSSFSTAISRALQALPSTESIVMAIEGEWGSGKTSVLNLIQNDLNKSTGERIVIRFESWLLASSDSIVFTFLNQLSANLGNIKSNSEDAKQIAQKLQDFSQLLNPFKFIPAAEPWLSMLQSALNQSGGAMKLFSDFQQADIQSLKAEIQDLIQRIGIPVIVIIDDLDRLESSEIKEIFRLVKAVADFKGISYLLSYDSKPVYQALNFEGVVDSAAFIEKIVQVSYPLPLPSFLQIKRFFKTRLRVLLSKYELEVFEQERLEQMYANGGVTHCLRKPRDVHRLINRLIISLPATRGEVNAGDLIVFEALATKYPSVAQDIRERPYQYVGGWLSHEQPLLIDYTDNNTKLNGTASSKKEIEQWKKNLWNSHSQTDQRIIRTLLDFLFPGFSQVGLSRPNNKGSEANLTINCRAALLKLLAIGFNPDIPSAKLSREILTQPQNRLELLNSFFEESDPLKYLYYFGNFINETDIVNPENVIDYFQDFSVKILEKYKEKRARQEIIHKLSFLSEKILNSMSEHARETYLKNLFEKIKSLSFTENIVISIAQDHNLWIQRESSVTPDSEKIIASLDTAKECIKIWINSVKKKASFGEIFFIEPSAISILLRWGELSENFDEVYEFTAKVTQTEEGIQTFIQAWRGSSLTGLDKLFLDLNDFTERCKSHSKKDSFRKDLWKVLDSPNNK